MVGPEGGIFNLMTQGVVNYIVSSNVLPDTPSANMKIALTSDYTVGTGAEAVTYEKGKVYVYNGTTSEWEEYTGADIAA
jgi:hypothetical protein